jgi:hypothetical protein
MTARRSLVAAALLLLWLGYAAAPGNPGAVRATNPWTLDLSPTALTVGVPINVTATVTDGSQMIGCVVFDVPAGFRVLSASVSSVPAGFVWRAAVAGSGPTHVTFSTTKDSWRLNGGASGVFVIRVIATATRLPAWTVSAYRHFNVDSRELDGGWLTAQRFTISSAATSSPVPTAAPPATLKPVAKPTPGSIPTSGPIPTAPPADESAAPSVTPLVTASPGRDPGPAAGTVGVGSGGAANAGGATGGGGAITLDVRELPAGGTVQLDGQAVGGIGMFAWMVPGLFLSLPGLLLLLIVVAQGGIATIFVPVTRRVLGARRRRHARGHALPAD